MNDLDDLGLETPTPAATAAAPAAAQAAQEAIGAAQTSSAAAVAATPAAEEPAKPTAPKGKYKTVYINGIRMKAKTNAGTPSEVESVAQFGVYRGNPRIIVRLNDPNEDGESRDTDFGRVQAAMDYATFEVFLGYIEEACHKTEKWLAPPIDNLSLYKGPQRFDTPQVVNTTLVGRTDDGRIWFSVRDGNRLAPKFVFGPGEFHHLRDVVTKAAIDQSEASRKYAQATCNVLRRLMPGICARFLMGEENEENLPAMDVKPAPGEDNGGGQRQGGWQGRGNGGGGGWQGRGNGGGGYGGRGGGGGGQWGNRGGGGGQWGGQRGGGGGYGGGRGNGGGGYGGQRGGGGGYGGGQQRQGGGGGGAPAGGGGFSDDDIQF